MSHCPTSKSFRFVTEGYIDLDGKAVDGLKRPFGYAHTSGEVLEIGVLQKQQRCFDGLEEYYASAYCIKINDIQSKDCLPFGKDLPHALMHETLVPQLVKEYNQNQINGNSRLR